MATFHMAIYAISLIMFALPISMPRFKSINFYQNSPKIKLFLQKNAKFFVCWGLFPQTPVPAAAGGFPPPPTPKTALHSEFLATRLVFLLLLCYLM